VVEVELLLTSKVQQEHLYLAEPMLDLAIMSVEWMIRVELSSASMLDSTDSTSRLLNLVVQGGGS